MGFIDRTKIFIAKSVLGFTERSVESGNFDVFLDYLNINTAGVKVDAYTAQNLSAVYASNKILSEDVAALPCKAYKRVGENIEIAKDNIVNKLVSKEPNTFMSPFTFFETAQTHLNLWGNFYARIARDSKGNPIELIPIHPNKVKAKIKNQLWYEVKGFKNLINARDMIHVLAFMSDTEEYKGMSPILQAKEMIGNGLVMQDFANKFFKNGANMSGILSTDQTLKEESIKNLKDSFGKNYTSIKNANKVAILESGLKYTKLSVEPEAAQFLQSRRFSVEEVARWFRIPPHMLAEMTNATFSNIEHQSISYVRQTLVPWLVRFEQEFNRKLFAPSEKEDHFVKFNVEGLLRGDSAARAEYYMKRFTMGSISQNEIRRLENQNPIDGGDKYYIMANMTETNKLQEDE